MSDTSARHGLPYIMPSQAQKHVTHNEAVRVLDALVQASVKSRGVVSAPEAPSEGDFYLVGTPATSAFSGYEGAIAGYIDGAWMFITPVQGLIVNVEDEAVSLIFRGENWEDFGGGGDIDVETLTFSDLGINGQADEFNRFLMNAPASLFNHEGAGHQLKINKASEGDTASLLFQTDFSGRAEMGLAGEDSFSIKVSSNGTDFIEALRIDKNTANVSFPATPDLTRPVLYNLFGDSGRFGARPYPLGLYLSSGFETPSYISPHNGAVLTQGDQYFRNSVSFGGTRPEIPLHLQELIQKIKPIASISALRYTPEFFVLSITSGDGVGGAYPVNGVTAYLAIVGVNYPISSHYTVSYWVRPTQGRCFVRRRSYGQLFIDEVEVGGMAELPLGVWTHVTRIVKIPALNFAGYDPSIYQLYLTHESACDFAAATLCTSIAYPDTVAPLGFVNSLTPI